jgi:hypothetical protein
MRRILGFFAAIPAMFALLATPAFACAGLIGPNGAVNLVRTTTFAGYHDGVEHYVTSFKFAGGSGKFGSLVPLPGVPSEIIRGGDWTLQRLIRETEVAKLRGVFLSAAAAPAPDAIVLQQVRIDALDITILKGGGEAVGRWATEHGFRLPPDAPEVLDFYAARSPIFMAAVFDADAAKARGQNIGDGTPVHLSIPTAAPWVPLRILGLGKTGGDRVDADVYLLTDAKPQLLPAPLGLNGLRSDYSATATQSLLDDLRSDKGMGWVPTTAWLSKVVVAASAAQLKYDLAISTTAAAPSPVAAGLEAAAAPVQQKPAQDMTGFVVIALSALAFGSLLILRTSPVTVAK